MSPLKRRDATTGPRTHGRTDGQRPRAARRSAPDYEPRRVLDFRTGEPLEDPAQELIVSKQLHIAGNGRPL